MFRVWVVPSDRSTDGWLETADVRHGPQLRIAPCPSSWSGIGFDRTGAASLPDLEGPEDLVGEGRGGGGLHAGNHVGVDVHREGDRCVAETLGDDFGGTPAMSRSVAWVWRRSWSRMRVTSVLATRRSNACVMRSG